MQFGMIVEIIVCMIILLWVITKYMLIINEIIVYVLNVIVKISQDSQQ